MMRAKTINNDSFYLCEGMTYVHSIRVTVGELLRGHPVFKISDSERLLMELEQILNTLYDRMGQADVINDALMLSGDKRSAQQVIQAGDAEEIGRLIGLIYDHAAKEKAGAPA